MIPRAITNSRQFIFGLVYLFVSDDAQNINLTGKRSALYLI